MTATGTRTKGNTLAYAVIGVFVAICAVGWAIIVAHTEGTPGISAEVISWRAADRSVRVHYQVAKPKGRTVLCTVVALDLKHAEVGRFQVTVPTGTTGVDTREDVTTSSRASAVDIRDCRAA